MIGRSMQAEEADAADEAEEPSTGIGGVGQKTKHDEHGSMLHITEYPPALAQKHPMATLCLHHTRMLHFRRLPLLTGYSVLHRLVDLLNVLLYSALLCSTPLRVNLDIPQSFQSLLYSYPSSPILPRSLKSRPTCVPAGARRSNENSPDGQTLAPIT